VESKRFSLVTHNVQPHSGADRMQHKETGNEETVHCLAMKVLHRSLTSPTDLTNGHVERLSAPIVKLVKVEDNWKPTFQNVRDQSKFLLRSGPPQTCVYCASPDNEHPSLLLWWRPGLRSRRIRCRSNGLIDVLGILLMSKCALAWFFLFSGHALLGIFIVNFEFLIMVRIDVLRRV